MANFPLLWAALADGQPVTAAELRQLAEYVQKCANFDGGSTHELDGVIEISGSNGEIHLTDGAKIVADGDGNIELAGSSSWLIANMSAIVSLEVVGASAKIEFGTNKFPELTSRSLVHTFTGDWVPINAGAGWNFDGTYFRWITSDAFERFLARRTCVQAGAVVTGVSVTIEGQAHGTWPPVMPTVLVYKLGSYLKSHTLLGSKTDDSAQGVYETSHEIDVTGLSASFSADEELEVILRTESGANAVAGTVAIGARYSATYTEIRPA